MRDILKFGFRYIGKFKAHYVVYLILCFFNSLIGIGLPLLLGNIINIITEAQSENLLLRRVIVFFSLSILQQVITFITNHIYLKIQSASGYYANREVLGKIYNSSYLNILQEDPALLNQKVNNDCNVVVIFCISLFRDVITNTVSFFFIAAILISQSYIIGGVLLILAALYGIIYLAFKKSIYYANYNVNQGQSLFFAKLYSIVSNMKAVRNNGFQSLVFEQQDKVFFCFYKSLYKRLKISNQFEFASNVTTLAAQMVLFVYGGQMVLKKKMSMGIFVILSNYFSNMIQTINYYLNLGESYQNTKTSYDRVMQYDKLPQISYGDGKIDEIQNISLNEVSFAYPFQKDLFKVSIDFIKGKIYWLQGNNGTGKTTLTNILTGLFGHDYTGRIEINNIPIKSLAYSNIIKKQISIVEQSPFLLSETYKNNLLLKTVAADKEKELNSLIEEFGLKHFFEKLPEGMDTVYNSLNDNISGGERQKLAIIRLLLSDSEVWILDEPAAALDKQSCKKLYNILEERKSEHIIILISHDTPPVFDEIINLAGYSPSVTDLKDLSIR